MEKEYSMTDIITSIKNNEEGALQIFKSFVQEKMQEQRINCYESVFKYLGEKEIAFINRDQLDNILNAEEPKL
jgi:hypothetical protein